MHGSGLGWRRHTQPLYDKWHGLCHPRMTLAIGFTCSDGLVVSADTEYSTDTSKHQAPKLWLFGVPEGDPNPPLRVVVSGAGAVGFLHTAAEQIRNGLKPDMDKNALQGHVQGIVDHLQFNHFANYSPDPNRQPSLDLLVAVWKRGKGKHAPERRLVKAIGTAVSKVWNYEAIGSGRDFANSFIRPLYMTRLSISSAVYLATQTTMYAKRHIPGVGGVTDIAVIHNDGTWGFVTPQAVAAHEKYLSDLERAIQPAWLGAIDPNVTPASFAAAVLSKMSSSLSAVRTAEFLDTQAHSVRRDLVAPSIAGTSPNHPPLRT
jgi:hypothetical protein